MSGEAQKEQFILKVCPERCGYVEAKDKEYSLPDDRCSMVTHPGRLPPVLEEIAVEAV